MKMFKNQKGEAVVLAILIAGTIVGAFATFVGGFAR
jgi:hypothetical protein